MEKNAYSGYVYSGAKCTMKNTRKKISLKAARVDAGFTQAEVAKKLKIGKVTLGNWETGISVPSYPSLLVLCDLYGFDVEDIRIPPKRTRN